MNNPQSNQQALALLDWYREMGADEVLAEIPEDWLSDTARVPGATILKTITQAISPPVATEELKPTDSEHAPNAGSSSNSGSNREPTQRGTHPLAKTEHTATDQRPTSHVSNTKTARSFQNTPPDESLAAAREAVQSVTSLEALHEKLLAFDGCGLKATAKNTCFYRGALSAKVMIIGEAPGRDEDLEGRPFVGRAGQLLDRMLKAIDLSDKDVHITNVVYWRPPGNRTPTLQEARVCRPFLEQQIHLVSPQIIVLLGGAAAKSILETTQGIMRLRGKWVEKELAGKHLIKVLPTLHPAYLLRTPAAKRLAWRDFLSIKRALEAKN